MVTRWHVLTIVIQASLSEEYKRVPYIKGKFTFTVWGSEQKIIGNRTRRSGGAWFHQEIVEHLGSIVFVRKTHLDLLYLQFNQ